ncbi:hypothetical protein TRAPUB_9738 [Trametes pubescens]|uniref:Uncharacterized protein n=1 Tax=Trametes pubescens TaxID=154538 RepID=A0A1M2W1R7_TRAPU|nr:hypothetical protein TRAPUB_9738 [Trametes pubescens]
MHLIVLRTTIRPEKQAPKWVTYNTQDRSQGRQDSEEGYGKPSFPPDTPSAQHEEHWTNMVSQGRYNLRCTLTPEHKIADIRERIV